MPKTDLVIVESPAKAKTIGKYLGAGYKVKASMGHLRDLPKSTLGVDLENDFEPKYIPLSGRESIISELRSAAEDSSVVYLATDPDREGEAISWHLKELLGLPDDKVRRVTFNEITKRVVTDSIEKPRAINMDLVDAQQARRILDRIVGYRLSPLLWKKIRRGLSAGRVQSVATAMVVDRENEIRGFVPREYWTLDVKLAAGDSVFTARLAQKDGKKYEPATEQETQQVIDDIKAASFIVREVKKTEKQQTPAPPFITSTLQQEASRRLNMSPKRTMAIAQQIYEGVEIAGMGAVGLITYMRTDSLRISDEARASARDVILRKYGQSYYYFGKNPRHKTKKGAQDAHEAIRPSDAGLEPDAIRDSLSTDQYRLYKLIWSRFLASQMSNAVYSITSADIAAGAYSFRSSDSELKFAGFTAVYEEGHDEEKEEQRPKLPALAAGESVELRETLPAQHFTIPPSRFTEATLVKAMEEKGVGRPSTYAATISIILDREYVAKDDKNNKILVPTPLGEVVTGLMKDKFSNIVDTEFTAGMETSLDEVEAGRRRWKDVLGDFYTGFSAALTKAEEELKDVHLKVPDELSDEKCDLCGRQMVVKSGRFGKFLACPGFPDCKFTKPIVVEMPGRCPDCGGRILKKTSKKGYAYYGCDKYPTCQFMTWDVPVKEDCPACGHTMFKKSGKGHKKPYCINEKCEKFVPEDKRGGRKKPAEPTAAAEQETAAPETPAKTPKTTSAKTAEKPAKTAEKPAKTAKKPAKAAKTEAPAKAEAAEKPAKKPRASKTKGTEAK